MNGTSAGRGENPKQSGGRRTGCPLDSAGRVARGRCLIARPMVSVTWAWPCRCSRFACLRLSWMHPALDEAEGSNDHAKDDRLHDRGCEVDCSPEERHESVEHKGSNPYDHSIPRWIPSNKFPSNVLGCSPAMG